MLGINDKEDAAGKHAFDKMSGRGLTGREAWMAQMSDSIFFGGK